MSGALAEWKAEWKREVARELKAEITKQVTAEVTREVTEEVTREVTEEVTKEVTKEVKTKHVLRMLEDGSLSLDKIAKYTELPLEQVKALAEQRMGR